VRYLHSITELTKFTQRSSTTRKHRRAQDWLLFLKNEPCVYGVTVRVSERNQFSAIGHPKKRCLFKPANLSGTGSNPNRR